jgi:hypothetical protein
MERLGLRAARFDEHATFDPTSGAPWGQPSSAPFSTSNQHGDAISSPIPNWRRRRHRSVLDFNPSSGEIGTRSAQAMIDAARAAGLVDPLGF